MEIKDFKGLTQFVSDEADKFFDTYGEKLIVDKLVGSQIKSLTYLFKLQAGYLRRKEKRDLQLKEALETMPHSVFWKMCNYTLWGKIKRLKASEFREEKIKQAIETMPHSFIWKLFNHKLWLQIKAIKAEQDNLKREQEEEIKQQLQPENEPQEQVKQLQPITAEVAVITVPEKIIEPDNND